MKTRILAALFALAFVLQAPAAEKDPAYEAELSRCIELQDLRATFEKAMRTPMQQFVDGGMMTAAQLDAMCKELVDLLYPTVLETMKEGYRKHFSQDELRQISAFYATPVGKKMISVAPELMQEAMATVQTPEMQGKIQALVIKHMTNK